MAAAIVLHVKKFGLRSVYLVVIAALFVAALCGCGETSKPSADSHHTDDRSVLTEAFAKLHNSSWTVSSGISFIKSDGSVQQDKISSDNSVSGSFDCARTVGRAVMRLNGVRVQLSVTPDVVFATIPKTKSLPASVNVKVASKALVTELMRQPEGPFPYLEAIRRADRIDKVGSALVNKIETTHYRLYVNSNTVDADQYRILAKLNQRFPKAQLAVEFWLDQQGRLAKMQLTLPVPASEVEKQKTSTPIRSIAVKSQFSNYGIKVTPTIPSTNDMIDASSLGSSLAKITSGRTFDAQAVQTELKSAIQADPKLAQLVQQLSS